MTAARIKELEDALGKIYDIAFNSYLYLKIGLGKPIDPLVNFSEIVDIIEVANPDDEVSDE